MIAIIDYKAGNLASVSDALQRLGVAHKITDSVEELDQAEKVIFPGVGHAKSAMAALSEKGLDQWLRNTKTPVLGICLGMQLMYESSEEGGDTKGLGIFKGRLKKFDESKNKVPHMGWNQVKSARKNELFSGIGDDAWFYHVHSFYAPVTEDAIGTCEYIVPFTDAVARENFFGVQFHPEKSGEAGEALLTNFIQINFQS